MKIDVPSLIVSGRLNFFCRWRQLRVITNEQYQAAKAVAMDSIVRFFPNKQSKPVFVPLHPNVAAKMNEIRTELDKQFPPLHPQLAADRDADEQPVHKKRRVEAPLPVHPPPPPPAHHAAPFDFDFDAGI